MKRRIAGLSALIAIGVFSVLFQSCGGGGKISDSTVKAGVAAARTGYVEGYIYTTAAAAQKRGADSAGADSYVPFATATVKVTCGSDVKTGATDSDGYYKIDKTPVGDCTLTATKAGYVSVEKKVTVAENEGTKASYTTDGRLLGRVLLEDNTTHSGTTVKITYGDQVKTVQTNEKGFYALPDVSGLNAKNVLIEATNSCDYFLPASSTMQVYANTSENAKVQDMTLLRLFKYTVTTDKTKYNSPPIKACLKVDYRGSEAITVHCANAPPYVYVKAASTGSTYSWMTMLAMSEDVEFPSPTNSDYEVCADNFSPVSKYAWASDKFEIYMTICNEKVPTCVGNNYESLMTPATIETTY